MDDLFESALHELEEMQVQLEEQRYLDLMAIIQASDYKNKCHMGLLDKCLLLYDPVRLRQIIDNVISNSYKYADTDILVNGRLEDQLFFLTFKDFGEGVKDQELELIFTRFYRGESALAKTENAAGLGLYTARDLMNRMGGDIRAWNESDGFVIELCINLA